jgi:hypothetical protein
MSITYYNEAQKENGVRFRKQANGFGFNLYLFAKLPAAYFSGVRLVSLEESSCKVKVPYKWFSQNPFKSTYFACLAMAAEMSTGLPCLMAIDKMNPKVSMLVVNLEANFIKKSSDIATFECKDAPAIYDAVNLAIQTKEGQTVKTQSIGFNKAGEEVANFTITWSFKAKS